MRPYRVLIVLLTIAALALSASAYAFESSSATFELHAGDLESTVGSTGTSATFKNTDAGGQNATGISTDSPFSTESGILYWLYGLFTPRYEQIHFRWRNDDGSEAAATFAATEDATLTNLAKNTLVRLRIEMSNEGWSRGSAPVFRLEYAETTTCSSGSYTTVPTVAVTEHWQMADSLNFVEASATTNVASGLTDANATFTPGEARDVLSTTSAVTLTSDKFTEIEYSIQATTASTGGGTYCFRVTNSGSTTNFVFTQYPKVTVSAGLTATGSLTSTVFDSGVTDGAAYNSILWKGTLNAGTGRVRFQIATSNCSNGATNAPTCNSGSWSFIGGATCGVGDWYDPGAPDTAAEITCAGANHNNMRYFRYKIQLCSASNCTDSGSITPQVDDVVISWSP